LIYLLHDGNRRARLAGATQSHGSYAAPDLVELGNRANAWSPIRNAIETGAVQRVNNLDALLGTWPPGGQPDPVREAAALPLGDSAQQRPVGFMIAGLSPRLVFDDDYRGFLQLTARDIAAAIANARARDENRKRAEALAEIEFARSQAAVVRNEAEQSLDEARLRKTEFLANMSHEIRSPMTAIMGYSDILLMHLRDPEDVKCVETIKESGRYLLEIINDILDLSKIEAGKLRVYKQQVELQALLREILSLMTFQARAKGLSLTLRCEGTLPTLIETDRTRLRQVIVNLLSNAIKFTERGGVEVAAKLRPNDASLQIDIIDSGIGISKDLQGQLFNVFTQADSSMTRRYGGTGLGLALSKRLIEMLNGSITFYSEPGKGSTFSVTIPRAATEEPSPDYRQAGLRALPGKSPLRGRRVLVTDDRPEIRYLIQRFFEDAGADVMTAASGSAAIDCVKEDGGSVGENVDLVVMDMSMPDVDGIEATRRLRDAGFKKPVIALTAAATKEDHDRFLKAGCDAYLVKPVEREALIDAAARYIAGYADTSDEKEARDEPAKAARKILLVDDHRAACNSLARLLEMSGYEVRAAFNGKTALALAQDFPADAVILDIKLPDMTGYELLKRLRNLSGLRAARYIALTGYADEVRSKDPDVNFDHFVLKPVDIIRLESLLD
jgi:signal transduction histidine kinase/DNA-binding response OmpR family regulator